MLLEEYIFEAVYINVIYIHIYTYIYIYTHTYIRDKFAHGLNIYLFGTCSYVYIFILFY